MALIRDVPEEYAIYKEKSFTFNNIKQYNRNGLLWDKSMNVDGLKTGHTEEAGYGLVGSAVQGNRRVTFVISGLTSAAARARESERIVNWAFRQFGEKTIATEGTSIAEADVFMGEADTVGLTAEGDLTLLLPVSPINGLEAEVVYTGPVQAPVTKGQELGQLVLRPDGLPEFRAPLVADRDVPMGGFHIRLMTAANSLLTKFTNGPAEAM